jgi:DNA-directed RNA polymerase specialized sigma24 family protein
MSDPAEPQPEQLLTSWLVESNPAQGQETLSRLIAVHAEPVVRRIVSFKLAGSSFHKNSARAVADIDDVCNEALRTLLTHLGGLKAAVQPTPPRNFSSYVAVTAFNACNEYFRDRSPARYRLANKLRYLLTHSSYCALWESSDGKDIAGSPAMRGQEPKTVMAPSQIAAEVGRQSPNQSLLDTVLAVFRAANGPLTFEAVLEIVADSTGLRETQTTGSNNTTAEAPLRPWERIPDTGPGVEAGLVGRQYIARLWTEICNLPLQQRAALLLNLKDSAGGDIQLFDWLGIATIQQISQSLEMVPDRFAALWKDLPLDDARIALELGIDRQDVINRRSSARKRLANRMKEYERGN